MQGRTAWAGLPLAVCLGLTAGPAAAVPDPVTPRLTVEPGRTVAGSTVVVDGSCPALPPVEDPPDDPVELRAPVEFPSATDLSWEIGGLTVKLDQGGEFVEPVAVVVPVDAEPRGYTVTTGCGGAQTLEVLAAPALDVVPAEAVRGQTVVVSGTCPAPPTPVPVFLDGEETTVVPEQPDGLFEDVAIGIPEDASAGGHTVTTSCGGSDTVTVLVPVDPPPDDPDDPDEPGKPEDPEDPDDLVPVPNLEGLTAGTAGRVLEAQGLLLAGVEGDRGVVTAQDPAPLTMVRAGTGVRVELAADDGSFPFLPAAGGGGLLLLLLAATPLSVHRRRLRRERRWLDRDVRVTPGRPEPLPGAPLTGPAPGLDVRIEAHRHRWPPRPGGSAP